MASLMDFDFVYTCRTGEFKTVHVTINVNDDSRLGVVIKSDEDIDHAEILDIVTQVSKQRLKRIYINTDHDTQVTLRVKDGQERHISLKTDG